MVGTRALLLASVLAACLATSLDDAVVALEDIALDLASDIGASFEAFQDAALGGEVCTAFDTCADELYSDSVVCDPGFGDTSGCGCQGRPVDTTSFVLKTTDEGDATAGADARNVACYTQGLEAAFASARSTNQNLKWLYAGTTDGVLVNNPAYLWGIDADGECSPTYDPRTRPWYLAGMGGPKDVIVIVDKSGSMDNEGRMAAAKDAVKTVVGGLTYLDFATVVAFSNVAVPVTGNTKLIPMTHEYRLSLADRVDDVVENGPTYYEKAFDRAFGIAEASTVAGTTTSGCTRIYMFMSDGEPSDDPDAVAAMINARKRPQDAFFFVGFGSDVSAATLHAMACAVDGFYIQVDDGDATGLRLALASYYQYLALGNADANFEVARWSEPYDSIPDIWGPVASAVAPIFDKRADPWTFLGVAAADVPLCELEALSGYTDDGGDVATNPTQQGCACEEGSYEYDGRTFEGCTSYDWSVPWCGTTNCGICDDLVSTGCWDECEDSGTVRGKMEAYLRGRSSAVCAGRIAAFTDGAIELTADATNALRESFPCPVGAAAAEDDEWISALTVANPFSVGADWRDDESSYDAQTLGRESSCGSLYEMQPCDSCDAALTPTCSYELCLSAAESGTREDAGDAYCSSSLDTGARANLHEGLLLFTALYAAARARP